MKDQSLAIISDCLHYENSNGSVGTRVHIFCRQMTALGYNFKKVIVICPVIKSSIPAEQLSYYPDTFEFIKLPVTGGTTWLHKINLLRTIPVWLKAFKQARKMADFFLLRFPNNLSIIGLYSFRKKKKFAMYTGTWQHYTGEPLTFRIQRYLLRQFFEGPVFIYSKYQAERPNFQLSYSPSYSLEEWETAENVIEARQERWLDPNYIPQFISAGSLLPVKNHELTLAVFKILKQSNFLCKLTIAGDGYLREKLEAYLIENDLTGFVSLAGHVSTEELKRIYAQSDFVIQLPSAEGFGKVPVEGFFYGLIPFLSNTAMSDVFIGPGNERGFLFQKNDAPYIAKFIIDTWRNKNNLVHKMRTGRNFAKEFTLDNWAQSVINVLRKRYE